MLYRELKKVEIAVSECFSLIALQAPSQVQIEK
jgi:hypothetical protein